MQECGFRGTGEVAKRFDATQMKEEWGARLKGQSLDGVKREPREISEGVSEGGDVGISPERKRSCKRNETMDPRKYD